MLQLALVGIELVSGWSGRKTRLTKNNDKADCTHTVVTDKYQTCSI